jgi:hypothetical protein
MAPATAAREASSSGPCPAGQAVAVSGLWMGRYGLPWVGLLFTQGFDQGPVGCSRTRSGRFRMVRVMASFALSLTCDLMTCHRRAMRLRAS